MANAESTANSYESAPQRIAELADGISVFNTLQSREIWKNRPIAQGRTPDDALFIDQKGDRIVFDGRSGLVQKVNPYVRAEFSGIVMVRENLEPTQYREIMEWFQHSSEIAYPGTVIMLLERKKDGKKIKKDWRNAILRGIETERELVKRTVLNGVNKEWIVWESQVGLLPADLLHEGAHWRRRRVAKRLQELASDPTISDYSAILNTILHTNDVQEAMGALESGFGVITDDNCPNGICQYEVGVDGSIYHLNSCGEDHSSQKDTETKVQSPIEDKSDVVYCGDHQGVEMKRNNKGIAICPHCAKD